MSENTEAGTVLTGSAIDFFFKRRIITAFEIEARGMKMNRGPSALQQVKMLGLVPDTCRSKKVALKAIVAHVKELMPTYEPTENVKKLMS